MSGGSDAAWISRCSAGAASGAHARCKTSLVGLLRTCSGGGRGPNVHGNSGFNIERHTFSGL
eukprot:2367109-Pyramimonas_sp.AAC.1